MGRRNRERLVLIRTGEAPTFRRVARERAREQWRVTVVERMEQVAPQFPEHLDLVAEVAAEMLREGESAW